MKFVLGLMMLSIAAPALADEAPPPKQDKKICRREQSTGSHMGSGTKICLTAAEWRERANTGSDDSDAMGVRTRAFNDIKSGSLSAGPH